MDNDLVVKEGWLKRNWKWAVPVIIVFIFIPCLLLISNS
jgi:hypothetical protein